MTEAKKYHAIRICRERSKHLERIEWLSVEHPKWSCGEPVDQHTKNSMLTQSRYQVAYINKYLNELRDPRNIK